MTTTFQHAAIHPAWHDDCGMCELALRNARLRPLLWAPGAPLPAPAPVTTGRPVCVHLGRRVRLPDGSVKQKLCRTG